MAKSTNRTRPLDRDGDGKDGGSLPGNKTAPMATGTASETAQPTDLADDASVIARRPEDLTGLLQHLLDGNALMKGEGGYGIDAQPPFLPISATETPILAGDMQVVDDQLTLTEKGRAPFTLTLEQLQAQDAVADEVMAAIAEAEPELVAQVIEDHAGGEIDTFDTEQVEAAGTMDRDRDQVGEAPGDSVEATPVDVIEAFKTAAQSIAPNFAFMLISHMNNGYPLIKCDKGYSWDGHDPYLPTEAVTPLIEAGYLLAQGDELNVTDSGREPVMALLRNWWKEAVVTVPNEDGSSHTTTNEALGYVLSDRPIPLGHAYNFGDLRMLAGSKFLYKSAEGYSQNYASPFIEEGVARMMLKDGLATFDEQAGHAGALRPTNLVRKVLADAGKGPVT